MFGCDAGWADCNRDGGDGCEVEIYTNPDHCGGCGRTCAPAHARGACASGTCGVGTCETGYADCNGWSFDGCETDLTSTSDCGICDNVCPYGARCIDGHCGGGAPGDTRETARSIDLWSAQTLLDADTTTAVHDTTGPCGCTATGRDVFFTFRLTQPELVYADTVGATWDTSLFFQDAAGANIATAGVAFGLACNDDGGLAGCTTGTLSQVLVRLEAGTYYLVLSGCGSGRATIRFQHLAVGTGTLVALAGGSRTLTGSTSGSSRVSTTCGSGVGPEAIYFWHTCPGAPGGTFTAATCGLASWDTILEQRSAARSLAACNDDGCDVQSSITAAIPTGPGIHVLQVDGFGGASGSYGVEVTRP
jgi:hypothetical protein